MYYVVIGGCLGGLLSGVDSRESAAVSRREAEPNDLALAAKRGPQSLLSQFNF